MPRYYFDITKDGQHHRDEVGDACEDFEDARAQAQVMLPDITKEELPDGDLHQIRCDVRDETGRVVYRAEITFQGTRDPG